MITQAPPNPVRPDTSYDTPGPGPDMRYGAWINLGYMAMPDSTLPIEQKGEQYCNQKARFFASQTNGRQMNWNRLQYATNAAFSRGQWGEEEDRLLFLKDGKRSTTRKELSIPVAHPMVMHHVGTAASIAVSAKATAVTQHAVTRKEEKKNRALALAMLAQKGPYIENAVMQTTGFGPDEGKNIADATGETYQDEFLKPINSIMAMQQANNDYEFLKNSNANVVACSGLFAMHCYRRGMRLMWEWVNPLDVAWGATNRADFKDCQYVIYNPLMNTAEICARWPVKKEMIKAMDEQASTFGMSNDVNSQYPQGMPRVMTVYWQEPVWVKMGYVLVDGVPYLAVLDEKDPVTGEVKYTEKDCIEPPVSKETREWTKRWTMGAMEQTWFCTFIPWEYSPYAAKAAESGEKYDSKTCLDIVLDYGPCELQETAIDEPFKNRFPLKLTAVEMSDGYVIAPLTFTISTQRIMNQVTSQLTWQMTKARNRSTWVNPAALDGTANDVAAVANAVKEGDLFELDPMAVGGAGNAVGSIDGGLDQGFYQLWSVIGQLQAIAQQATGIYDSSQGKASNAGQLVGTTELLLQQSNKMMQSFTQCIIQGFKQVHQFDAQAGKEFYMRYPWALEEMTGTRGLEALMLSPEMAVEQFRAEISPTVNAEQLKAATDQMILQFVELQILDPSIAAELGGRSFPEDVWAGVRRTAIERSKALEAQAQEKEKQEMAGMLATQAQKLQEEKQSVWDRGFDLMADRMKIDQKLMQPIAQRGAEAAIPVPGEQSAAASPGA